MSEKTGLLHHELHLPQLSFMLFCGKNIQDQLSIFISVKELIILTQIAVEFSGIPAPDFL